MMSEHKDELDSVCSNFSMVSVGGDEMTCEEAIDESIKATQQGLNNLHISMRNMLTWDERGLSYDETKDDYDKLYALIAELMDLIKTAKSIVKQVQPRKPRQTTTKTK